MNSSDKPLHIFLVAGEQSGDALGASLMARPSGTAW